MKNKKNADKYARSTLAQPKKQQGKAHLFLLFSIVGFVTLLMAGICILWRIAYCEGCFGTNPSPPPLQFLITSILSLLVFFGIIGQILIYWRMSSQNERLIETAESSAKVAREAFKAGEGAHFGIILVSHAPVASGQQPWFDIEAVNGGKTPAWYFQPNLFLCFCYDPADEKVGLNPTPQKFPSNKTFIPAGERRPFHLICESPYQAGQFDGTAFGGEKYSFFIKIRIGYLDFRNKWQDREFVWFWNGTDFEDYPIRTA